MNQPLPLHHEGFALAEQSCWDLLEWLCPDELDDSLAWLFLPVGEAGMLRANAEFLFRLGEFVGVFADSLTPPRNWGRIAQPLEALKRVMVAYVRRPYLPDGLERSKK